ncbi:MAG: hypothetical protein STHCBS139747_006648 [Sporothrix thermara]
MLTKIRAVSASTPKSNAKSTCTSPSCSGVALGVIIGCAVLICMAACVAYCCNRGRRKVKNAVKDKFLGMIFKSSGTNGNGQPADDEERLRPRQAQPTGPQTQTPIYYYQQQRQRYGQSYSNPADAPYAYPRYPEYPDELQYPPRTQPWQPRQAESSKREVKQPTRAIAADETPIERQMRLNRLATKLASSM